MALAAYVGLVQFLFGTTWTLYVVYLPQLAQAAGIGREWVPWILIADQLAFAAMDIVTGFWIDRVRAALGRFGVLVMAGSLLSAVAFLALPYAGTSASVLLVAIAIWAITSSALRSPPWALLARYAPRRACRGFRPSYSRALRWPAPSRLISASRCAASMPVSPS